MKRFRTLVLVVITLWMPRVALAADPPKPPEPPATVPELRNSKAVALCIDCDAPFDTATHKKVLDGLVNNPYIGELRKALYLQDSVHQFASRAHFDNCDFDGSIGYIDAFLAEIDTHVQAATKARAAGDAAETQAAAQRAFFAIGQALHGVQDFYAHSNYVELAQKAVKRVPDLEVVAPWRSAGKARIVKLRNEGLLSGFVFWGFPQLCPAGAPSHSDIAKDSETTTSGKVKVPHLQNLSQYRIAVYLAREASLEFLRDAFKRWPLLKELNGNNVAFEVLLDRRGI